MKTNTGYLTKCRVNSIQTSIDPTQKLPPKPFIHNTRENYYNITSRGSTFLMLNKGEETSLYRKRETQGGLINTVEEVRV